MSNGPGHKSVPPFIEEPPPASQRKTSERTRLTLMLLASGMLLASMLGAGKLLWEILGAVKPSTEMLVTKLAWLALLFLVGWIVSLVNIRVLHNLVQPLVINGFIWLILMGILVIYARVIFRFYNQDFSMEQYLRYSLVFIAGFSVFIGLHLLLEDHDLRPCAIPMAAMTFIHLIVAAFHYIFQDGNPDFAAGDAIWLFVMFCICLLMVLHLGILNPFRQTVNRLFLNK